MYQTTTYKLRFIDVPLRKIGLHNSAILHAEFLILITKKFFFHSICLGS
jgi:hypothetical protein